MNGKQRKAKLESLVMSGDIVEVSGREGLWRVLQPDSIHQTEIDDFVQSDIKARRMKEDGVNVGARNVECFAVRDVTTVSRLPRVECVACGYWCGAFYEATVILGGEGFRGPLPFCCPSVLQTCGGHRLFSHAEKIVRE